MRKNFYMKDKLNLVKVEEEARLGFAPKEIAQRLGYKEASVRTALYKSGFRFPQPVKRKGIVEDKKLEIIELFLKGNSSKEIGKLLDLNSVSVNCLLNKYGFHYNPQIGNPTYFETIDSSNKAYFLGFICADGSIVENTSGSKILTITLHEQDLVILEKLKSELRSTHAIMPICRVSSHNPEKIVHHVRLAFANKSITNALNKLEITERKTFTLGNIINNIPYEYRDAFIIGYLDGDGCIVNPKTKKLTKKGISYHNNQSRIVSFKGTYELLNGFVQHLNLERYSLRKNKNQNVYTLTFSSKQEVSKIASCYANTEFFLLRKFKKLQTSELYQAQTISSS